MADFSERYIVLIFQATGANLGILDISSYYNLFLSFILVSRYSKIGLTLRSHPLTGARDEGEVKLSVKEH